MDSTLAAAMEFLESGVGSWIVRSVGMGNWSRRVPPLYFFRAWIAISAMQIKPYESSTPLMFDLWVQDVLLH